MAKPTRQERLEAQLRENLKRRREQARGRRAGDGEGAAAGEAATEGEGDSAEGPAPDGQGPRRQAHPIPG
ncbi:hypothetical protein [Aurantimonas sp. Leaf443]|uniref:hypothetical protein n=1 Tax=Aurantimonas sp. Leaf443 TaxID=1736378 RepID=UPI0007009908|nr:hypothetical protein [Aurantimonas sp. Leaf443]KQT85780.1 hypothetical protein ASG48_03940 [Aurantimonas sp. Leaf443]